MIDYQAASLFVAEIAAWASVASALTGIAVVILMWQGIKEMVSANKDRAAQAAEDRKAMQAQAAEAAAQAAEDRKVTQTMLASLERQGAALEELLRRTSPPQPGPAE